MIDVKTRNVNKMSRFRKTINFTTFYSLTLWNMKWKTFPVFIKKNAQTSTKIWQMFKFISVEWEGIEGRPTFARGGNFIGEFRWFPWSWFTACEWGGYMISIFKRLKYYNCNISQRFRWFEGKSWRWTNLLWNWYFAFTSKDVDEQLLKDYHILLTVWPFVEHMYLIEKDSDRQLYISYVNGLYGVLEDLICEFYSILVNRDGAIPPLETPTIVPEAYKEMSAASRHLYHYLVARDMQHIVSLLDNRYRDMW